MQPRGLTVEAAIELMLKRGWTRVIDDGEYHQLEHPEAEYPITIVGEPGDVLSREAAETILSHVEEVAVAAGRSRGQWRDYGE